MFKLKTKIAGITDNDDTKVVKIMVPSKYLTNFSRTLEIPLFRCEINLMSTWYANYFITDNPIKRQDTIFVLTVVTVVPVVTLLTQDNAKLLQQLKWGFKRTINCNKYQSKVTIQDQNRLLDYLIDPSFPEVYHLKIILMEQVTSDIIFRE